MARRFRWRTVAIRRDGTIRTLEVHETHEAAETEVERLRAALDDEPDGLAPADYACLCDM